jgi:hypothetical protein
MSPAGRPLSAAVGAEVSGIDSRGSGSTDAEALREASLKHHVVVAHGLKLG